MDESVITEPVDQNTIVAAPKKPNRRRVWIGLSVIVLIILAGLVYWYLYRPPVQEPEVPTYTGLVADTATTTEIVSTDAPVPVTAVERIVDPGITWLTDRTKMDDQGITRSEITTPPTYYKVGTTADGDTLVMLEVAPEGPSGMAYVLLKKTAAGQWLRYTQHSDSLDYYPHTIDTIKVTDTNAVIPSLDIPSRLTVGNVALIKQSTFQTSFEYDGASTKIADTPYGDLMVSGEASTTGTDADSIVGKMMRIARNDGRYTQVKVELPFLRDDKTVALTAPDGKGVSGSFLDEGQGCGRTTTTTSVANTAALNQKVAVGTASDGSTVYTLNAADNPILKTYYEQYASSRSYEGSEYEVVSFETYRQSTPVLLWQDGYGQWVVLQNDAYAMLAECGKPVVYLYPQTDTPVTVLVGAEITKSEPSYNNGWSGVAKPDSQIVVDGVTYPYLFWEGHGEGVYPDTSAVGVVVPQNQVRATLDRQLDALGLTDREQADFTEFWVPLLPTDPYVRLTWLTTAAMNQIAPLTITPEPDTLIRVFLDFEGMVTPVSVRPQTLRAVPRVGFTAVEWGGLLHHR